MNIKIKVDKYISVNVEMPEELDLIEFLGIADKMKKLGKTIEIPIETETETGITKEIKNKIIHYYRQATSYEKISEKIKNQFGVELNRQELQEICLEMGVISKILPHNPHIKKTQQPIYTAKTDLTAIYKNEELINQVAEKIYSVNYASSKVAEWLNVRGYNITKEQGKEIKNYLKTNRNDLRQKYMRR